MPGVRDGCAHLLDRLGRGRRVVGVVEGRQPPRVVLGALLRFGEDLIGERDGLEALRSAPRVLVRVFLERSPVVRAADLGGACARCHAELVVQRSLDDACGVDAGLCGGRVDAHGRLRRTRAAQPLELLRQRVPLVPLRMLIPLLALEHRLDGGGRVYRTTDELTAAAHGAEYRQRYRCRRTSRRTSSRPFEPTFARTVHRACD